MKDHLDLNYNPNFIDLIEGKPKLIAQKKQLIIYYLSSYFLKKTKKEILNRYDHHRFYWNTKNELIFSLPYILGNSDLYDKHEDYQYNREIPDNSHTEFFLLYNFTTRQIAIQGYLKNKKKKIDYWENEVIEDIEQFTDNDFKRILDCVPVDYHIRDEQIKEALDDIIKSLPVNRFYTYRNGIYDSYETILGYLYRKVRNKDSVTLYFNRYSVANEKLDEKKKDKFEINFLKKDKFIEDHKIVLKEDLYVKEKIYIHRESVIKNLKETVNQSKASISKHELIIKSSQEAIKNLNNNIDKYNKEIEQKTNDLNNTIVEDIKIL